jgi:hypothetical protein
VGHETYENHALFTTIKNVFEGYIPLLKEFLIGVEKSFTEAESSKFEHNT